ncbi:EF-hand calcium-binding domain-containing protein 11-like isoform X2 [Octopus sinensis]|uniref:EF-hand calcium-binding domain-containing protein 11-like isoform X2 n=1 Tax=Octopus sinensis TaxID=2607531 RepID=A0A7E6F6G5_9MOLL|nr:EF-hand calcium-binding domain-containing protein 11-like isoform X2 [Octopus sinensis]
MDRYMDVSRDFTLAPNTGYRLIKRTLQAEDISLLRNVFKEFDEGNKKYLSREDIKMSILCLFGYKPSKYETDRIMQAYSDEFNEEMGLTLESFIKAMTPKMAARDENEEIRLTFMAFDFSCHGFLTIADLKKVFKEVAPKFPEENIEVIFREVDQDGDGRVSFKDFEFMMKYDSDNLD